MEGLLLKNAIFKISIGFVMFLSLGAKSVLADDPMPADFDRSGKEVFDRITQSLDPKSCTPKAKSGKWMKNYIHYPNKFAQQLASMLPLLDHVSLETQARGLPMEFALIPFVESRYLPDAVAKGGPTGLWQMMPNTAKHYGLQIGGKNDGRFSTVESTDAALSYLAFLQKTFADWQTSIMAYNAGDSRLRVSLKRQGLKQANADSGLPTGLAPHTYAYVRKIESLVCFFLNPEDYGVTLPMDKTFMPLEPESEAPIVIEAEKSGL
jgi:membrane-bound lytic murein transglycosylase D